MVELSEMLMLSLKPSKKGDLSGEASSTIAARPSEIKELTTRNGRENQERAVGQHHLEPSHASVGLYARNWGEVDDVDAPETYGRLGANL